MKAVILAGGRGSRLRPLTDVVPKPMVRLYGKPVMQYVVEGLVRAGISDIAVALCYKPDVIRGYFGDGAAFGARLRYFVEDAPLGTAGAVKAAADFLDEPFVVASADAFTDLDFGALCRAHVEGGAAVTIAVAHTDDVAQLGAVRVADGIIVAIDEKSGVHASGLVSAGIYCLDPSVLQLIPKGRRYDFAKDLFPRLVGRMRAFETKCFWCDVGTPETLEAARRAR